MLKFMKITVLVLFIIANFIFGTVAMGYNIFFSLYGFDILQSCLAGSCVYLLMLGGIVYLFSQPTEDNDNDEDEFIEV